MKTQISSLMSAHDAFMEYTSSGTLKNKLNFWLRSPMPEGGEP